MTKIECRESRSEMIFLAVLTMFVLVFVMHVLSQSAGGLPSIFIYFGRFLRFNCSLTSHNRPQSQNLTRVYLNM
jgi:uncharacterized membrane protein